MQQDPQRPRVRFNAEINLGHVLQIIAFVGAVVLAWATLDSKVAVLDNRLTNAEHALIERRAEEREFATEMRTALDDIRKGLAQLQVLIASVDKPKR